MKKTVISVLLAIFMLAGVAVTAFADEGPALGCESSFDADANLVTVSVYIENALGLESADINLGYDYTMFEYVEYFQADGGDNLMAVGGKATTEEGLCTCSLCFTEYCVEEDLDENGRLQVASYTFKPLTDDFDANNFCVWVSSYDADGKSIVDSVEAIGNVNLMEDRTAPVTVNENAGFKADDSGISGESDTNWYVYVIAGVLAVAGIAGVAIIASKKSHHDEDDDDDDNVVAAPSVQENTETDEAEAQEDND